MFALKTYQSVRSVEGLRETLTFIVREVELLAYSIGQHWDDLYNILVRKKIVGGAQGKSGVEDLIRWPLTIPYKTSS